jgi:hypothetical protein
MKTTTRGFVAVVLVAACTVAPGESAFWCCSPVGGRSGSTYFSVGTNAPSGMGFQVWDCFVSRMEKLVKSRAYGQVLSAMRQGVLGPQR